MDNRISAHHLHQLRKPTMLPKKLGSQSPSFKDMLTELTSTEHQLKVSKHAEKRLQDRNIVIDQAKWDQISSKVQEAKLKGVHDSLVVLSDAALVISAKNSTVITALDRQEAASQIFTNINGTIILD